MEKALKQYLVQFISQLIKGDFTQNEYPFWLTKFINKVKIQVCFYAKQHKIFIKGDTKMDGGTGSGSKPRGNYPSVQIQYPKSDNLRIKSEIN